MKSNYSSRKTVVILWDQEGQFANELWNYMSVFAYCLEKGYELKNYAFYKQGKFLSIPVGNPLVDWLYFKPFPVYQSLLSNRFGRHFSDRLYRYTFFKPMKKLRKSRIIYGNERVIYLPPTRESESILKQFEQDSGKIIYFCGWLFRNPVGLRKYRRNILNYFKFKDDVHAKVQQFTSSLRSRYRHLVGVHIRQADYREFWGGRYYVSPQEAAIFARQYLQFSQKAQLDTCFIICSDGDVDLGCFNGLNVERPAGNLVEDFLVLASTDLIIGSNSTYGALASWYGNIPHVIMLKEGIDWSYYQDKQEYFESKYNTTVHF
jgi:hypothetical protein